MSNEYYLPPETARQLTPDHLRRCKNLGLILDKYPPKIAIDTNIKSDGKSSWLKGFAADDHIDQQLVESVYKRWLNALEGMQAKRFVANTEWRMVVGLGGETVLETDLTLHHLYGIPFIPGSALKGLTRAYVTGEVYKSKKIEDDGPEVQRIFGTQNDAGSIIFFDAMPVNDSIGIDLDIMNVHYPKYYAEKQPPANNQNPNPIPFLTVANTSFVFALAPRDSNNSQHRKDVGLVETWLRDALQKYGIGGKTSAGYGYFMVPPQQQDASSASPQSETSLVSYVRPNIPNFNVGNGISGIVVAPTDELRSIAPEARAYLRFREFPTKDVLIIIEAEEAANWMISNMRNCLFVREEARGRCTVLICQPGVSKKKKK